MNKFPNRLKELREERELSLTELAKQVGVSQVAISRWESASRIPNIETLITFAKYFEVSSDFLVGLEDE